MPEKLFFVLLLQLRFSSRYQPIFVRSRNCRFPYNFPNLPVARSLPVYLHIFWRWALLCVFLRFISGCSSVFISGYLHKFVREAGHEASKRVVKFPNCHECPEASGLGNLTSKRGPFEARKVNVSRCFVLNYLGSANLFIKLQHFIDSHWKTIPSSESVICKFFGLTRVENGSKLPIASAFQSIFKYGWKWRGWIWWRATICWESCSVGMEAFPAGGDGYRILRVAADLNIWQLRRREGGGAFNLLTGPGSWWLLSFQKWEISLAV